MSQIYSIAKEKRRNVFLDTKKVYETDDLLINAIQYSISKQKIILESDVVEIINTQKQLIEPAMIVVSKKRSLDAARGYIGQKVCVHNFASATNPGGGVENGASAQEEALCRCSTLYPCISTQDIRNAFHENHRRMLRNGELNALYNDDCIYTPEVVVFKSDSDEPELLPKEKWYKVDVISCAAPNLRSKLSNVMNPAAGNLGVAIKPSDLLNLHMKRIRKILDVARVSGAEVMILGAFGCGAFKNSPDIVAEAMVRILPEYQNYFKVIEFAVYCPPGSTQNYDIFNRRISLFNNVAKLRK